MKMRGHALNVALALIAVLLLVATRRATGEIPVNDGRGWDGMDYAAMLSDGLRSGSANAALRPLVVVANRPAYWLLGSPIRAFRAMNYLYLGLLAFALCRLFDRYGGDRLAKTLVIVNVFLCIATVQYIAYYPVLIDPGAYAVVAIAIYAIVSGNRMLAVPMVAAAVLAREFAVATVAFGVVRDLRRRVPVAVVIGTYAPAIVAFVALRTVVRQVWADEGEQPLSTARLLVNLQLWHDPVFAAFFLYFAVTVFGGVSLFVVARAAGVVRHWLTEWEWGIYCGAIVVAAAAGDADIWRYLAYLLPAMVVAFAVAWRELDSTRQRLAVGALVCAATIVTQRPFQHVDLDAYFVNWFPYYVQRGSAPVGHALMLWPLWGWRLLGAVGFLWALGALTWFAPPAPLQPDTRR
jgi:hypothetical protein